MRTVIQRVSEASVTIDGEIVGSIKQGLLILLGIEAEDMETDIAWMVQKILNLRIFDDEQLVPNRSVMDIEGGILLISQFTLFASTKKGNRPSYIRAAKPDVAIPIYEKFKLELQKAYSKQLQTGVFGANMQVSLINDGPFTILIDSRDKE